MRQIIFKKINPRYIYTAYRDSVICHGIVARATCLNRVSTINGTSGAVKHTPRLEPERAIGISRSGVFSPKKTAQKPNANT